jgi:MOSC domain-containing protein YiiM
MTMSEIVSIVYKPGDLPARPEDHYTRVPLESARLIVGHGIEGDRKGGHPTRQLNIMAAESLDQLAAEGFKIAPGEMGEQIIVRGVPVDTLATGDRLRIGPDAIIEVTTPRTGCDRFEALQGHSPAMAAGRLGTMAKVVADGTIRLGDRIEVLAERV